MELLDQWLSSELGPTFRILSALMPAIVLAAYFLIGVAVFAIRNKIKGEMPIDAEVEQRGGTRFLNKWIRHYFVWAISPLWNFIFWLGIPATSITLLSVLLSAGAGVGLAFGKFALGGWLYIFAGICDMFDGRIARLRGEASKAGAMLDSSVDRYAEAFVFIGLAYYYRDSWVMVVAFGAFVGSVMVSYARAKGESMGVTAVVGSMQRAERLVYLGMAAIFSPILEAILVPDDPHPPHRLTIICLVFILIGANATGVRRIIYVMRELSLRPDGSKRGRPSTEWTMFSAAVVASVVATGADFALVNVLVEWATLHPTLATFCGCALGGVINFVMNKFWAFRGNRGTTMTQSFRYAMVSGTSALLNSGGVGMLLLVPGLDYRIAWIIIRIAIYSAWNYPLQRNYVFPDTDETPGEGDGTGSDDPETD